MSLRIGKSTYISGQRTLILVNKEEIKLTPREGALLEFLVKRKNETVQRGSTSGNLVKNGLLCRTQYGRIHQSPKKPSKR